MLDGVACTVVEDRESKSGQLVEVALDYNAVDPATQDVYYFGEELDEYKGGKISGHGGTWLAGVERVRFGRVMPAGRFTGCVKIRDTSAIEKLASDAKWHAPAPAWSRTASWSWRELSDSAAGRAAASAGRAVASRLLKNPAWIAWKLFSPRPRALAQQVSC